MNIQQQLQALADATGAHIADVRGLAQGIVESMIADGFKAEHLAQPEGVKVELVAGYMSEQLRKTDRFVTTYLTRQGAREAFSAVVLASLS